VGYNPWLCSRSRATVAAMRKLTSKLLFGRRVRELREQTGQSQEGFALAVGIDRSHYSAIERGRTNPCLETMTRLAAALDVPILELFRWK
jgi:transcriptional regulator with XRE-family HTH domain